MFEGNTLYLQKIRKFHFRLNRRLLRVKVFKVLFGRATSGMDSLQSAEKELLISCDKAVDLYCFLLLLPVSLKRVAQNKIEAGLKKFYPTPEEANPNMRFVENKLIELCEEHFHDTKNPLIL